MGKQRLQDMSLGQVKVWTGSKKNNIKANRDNTGERQSFLEGTANRLAQLKNYGVINGHEKDTIVKCIQKTLGVK